MVLASKRDQLELEKFDQDNTGMTDTDYREYVTGQQSCSKSRIWLILSVVFLLTSLALGAYLVYVKIFEQSEQISYEEEIVRRYPGYFRTPEEQAIFAQQYQQVALFTNYSTVNNTYVNCSFSCTTYRRKRSQGQSYIQHPLMEMDKLYSIIHAMSKRASFQAQTSGNVYTYHACCKSQHKFISPDSGQDANGKTFKLLKLKNQAQYFLTETCQQADGCTGCRCGQSTTLTSAVVTVSDSDGTVSAGLKLIQMLGCCKCHNGVPT